MKWSDIQKKKRELAQGVVDAMYAVNEVYDAEQKRHRAETERLDAIAMPLRVVEAAARTAQNKYNEQLFGILEFDTSYGHSFTVFRAGVERGTSWGRLAWFRRVIPSGQLSYWALQLSFGQYKSFDIGPPNIDADRGFVHYLPQALQHVRDAGIAIVDDA